MVKDKLVVQGLHGIVKNRTTMLEYDKKNKIHRTNIMTCTIWLLEYYGLGSYYTIV